MFVKIEDFIAWKCIGMHEMTKKIDKSLYVGCFSKFFKLHIVRKSQFYDDTTQSAPINSIPEIHHKILLMIL